MRSLLFLALLGLSAPAWAVPAQFVQQGRLSGPDGSALEGSHDLRFRLYGEPMGGEAVWEEGHRTSFTAGVYTVTLGGTVAIDSGLLQAYPLWLELEVDGNVLAPRQAVSSAPYAGVAGVAERLEGGTVDASGVSVAGTEVISGDGRWVGPTPNVAWLDLSGVPAELLDGDADTLAGISCADGEALVYDAFAGAWGCGVSGEGVLTESEVRRIVEAAPLNLAEGSTLGGRTPRFADEPDADTLAGLSCLDGEIPRWDGAALEWICGADVGLDAAAVGALLDARAYAAAGDLSALSAEVAALGSTLGTLSTEVADGRVDLHALALTCDSLTGEVADLDGRIGVLESGALSVSADLAGLGARLTALETGVSGLEGRLTAAEAGGLVLESRVGALEADAAAMASTLAAQDGRLIALEGAADADSLGDLSCADGDVPKWDVVAGVWACGADLDADTLAELGCASGQLAKWNGSAWACAADLTLTEAQVDAYVSDNGYASASALTAVDARVTDLQGDVSDLSTRLDTWETDADETNGLLAAVSSTVDGLSAAYGALESTVSGLASSVSGLATRVSVLEGITGALAPVATSGSWSDLLHVPTDLADGDDDSLAGLACSDGEVPQYDGGSGLWVCGSGGGASSGRWIDVVVLSGGICGVTDAGALRCTYGYAYELPQTGVTEAEGHGGTVCWLDTNQDVSCTSGLAYWTHAGTYTQVVVGDRVCALDTAGGMDCWYTDHSSYVRHPGPYTHIAARGGSWGVEECGLKTTGTVECWEGPAALSAPSGTFAWLSRMSHYRDGAQWLICGKKTDGTLYCWNSWGDRVGPRDGTNVVDYIEDLWGGGAVELAGGNFASISGRAPLTTAGSTDYNTSGCSINASQDMMCLGSLAPLEPRP